MTRWENVCQDSSGTRFVEYVEEQEAEDECGRRRECFWSL